ncbi:MAG: hypothetical protein WCW16_01640 [Candidatus Magasanikbacteria bacterium]
MLLSAGDVISRSVKLCRDNMNLFLKYSGLILVPTLLVTLAGYTVGITMVASQSFAMGLGLYLILVIALALFGFMVGIALMKAVAMRYEGQTAMPLGEALKNSMKYILPGILVAILTGLATLGGFLLLIIPGIIFGIWFAFSFQALVIDDKHGTDALKTSKHLVHARWFGVFWRLFLPALVFGLLYMALQWILQLILGVRSEAVIDSTASFTVRMVMYTILTSILSALLTPFTTAASTILYIELKKNPVQIGMPTETKVEEPPKE